MAAVAWAAAAAAAQTSAATVAAARTASAAVASAAVAVSDAPARSRPCRSGRMWVLGIAATFCGLFWLPGKKMERPAAWLYTRSCHLAACACSNPQCAQLGSALLRWGYPAGVWCWKLRPRGARLGLSPSPALQESSRLARLSATAAWGAQSGMQSWEWGGSLSSARGKKGRQTSNHLKLPSVCDLPKDRQRVQVSDTPDNLRLGAGDCYLSLSYLWLVYDLWGARKGAHWERWAWSPKRSSQIRGEQSGRYGKAGPSP